MTCENVLQNKTFEFTTKPGTTILTNDMKINLQLDLCLSNSVVNELNGSNRVFGYVYRVAETMIW